MHLNTIASGDQNAAQSILRTASAFVAHTLKTPAPCRIKINRFHDFWKRPCLAVAARKAGVRPLFLLLNHAVHLSISDNIFDSNAGLIRCGPLNNHATIYDEIGTILSDKKHRLWADSALSTSWPKVP
jgi:hypothetical protein